MSKLIEIAKECGASETSTTFIKELLVMKPDELRATVEQVAGPLVEALKKNQDLIKTSIDISLGIKDPLLAGAYHDEWNANAKIIKAYTEIMGEKK